MLPVLIALALLAASVAGLYLLLKSMGEDGVEAAAPGSCRSGRCGVPPRQAGEGDAPGVEVGFVQPGEIRRIDGSKDKQGGSSGMRLPG